MCLGANSWPLLQSERSRTTRTWWSRCSPGPGTARTRSSSRSARGKTRSSKTPRFAPPPFLGAHFSPHQHLDLFTAASFKRSSMSGTTRLSFLPSELLPVEEGQEGAPRHQRQGQRNPDQGRGPPPHAPPLREGRLPDPVSPPQENFCGTSIIVPDLEAVLHLREDGKKSWKQRLFHLRASGIYYVPKGKTKVSEGRVGGLTNREENVWKREV